MSGPVKDAEAPQLPLVSSATKDPSVFLSDANTAGLQVCCPCGPEHWTVAATLVTRTGTLLVFSIVKSSAPPGQAGEETGVGGVTLGTVGQPLESGRRSLAGSANACSTRMVSRPAWAPPL